MQTSKAIAFAAIAALAGFASGAGAQTTKVVPAQMFYDGAYEAAVPADGGTTTLTLGNLKTAHAGWLTCVNFTGGKPMKDAQVIALMESMTVKWAGSKESCVYELRLVSTPPTITISKAPGMCALKPPGNMVFKVLAM